MTRGICPNCGAPLDFKWPSSVQTVCAYCKSIVIRTDVDIRKVGMVADLPPDSSPIQLGTEGIYNNRAFTVAGRIIYEYELGTWNEWHVVQQDGSSAWLSDAQSQYCYTVATAHKDLPPATDVRDGNQYVWDNVPFTVTTITEANYRGVEGELPFQYWDKTKAVFADCMSPRGDFATLDYSDPQPVLYRGVIADFDSLHLKNLRTFEGW
ncbi:MAG TPA: DUF4178 domain-containing protein [Candidatus Koribacter sp.]|jgi:hypothetical protein